MGPGCSAYTLSFASACALTSSCLFIIAFATDNWRHVSVDRDAIAAAAEEDGAIRDSLVADHRYFDRVQVRKMIIQFWEKLENE